MSLTPVTPFPILRNNEITSWGNQLFSLTFYLVRLACWSSSSQVCFGFLHQNLKKIGTIRPFVPFSLKQSICTYLPMSYRPYYNMYPNPQYFAFLFAKSLFVLKHSRMKTMLMHFFLRGEEGAVYYGEDEESYLRGELLDGWVGICLVQGCSPLLSLPVPPYSYAVLVVCRERYTHWFPCDIRA